MNNLSDFTSQSAPGLLGKLFEPLQAKKVALTLTDGPLRLDLCSDMSTLCSEVSQATHRWWIR